MAARRSLALGTLALWALVAACVQNDGSRNPFSKLVKVTVEQERERGAGADAELQKVIPLIDDPVVLGFINDLGQAVVKTIEPQPFIYRFRVVVDPALNAFAMPGGYIYFHSGTILQAGSIDELAGVMAHEIAHVKGRHYARLVEKAMIPDLLAQIGGIAATIATENPAPMIVSQAANVALQLRYTRAFEAEADELGGAFMARSGYDPEGMARFFQRIVAAERNADISRAGIPPYLFSHPEVESRIDSARSRAEHLTVTGEADPELARALPVAQIRLALLLRSGQTTLPPSVPPPDRVVSDGALDEANALASDGELARAIALLEAGESQEPNDPRLPYRRGELLDQAERRREAIAAWRRALRLDPSVALNYFRIGMAYKSLGDRVNATFYLEQAFRRFEDGGARQRRAAEEIARLTFPVIAAAGISDGSNARGSDTIAGHSREEFRRDEPQAVWWASVGSRYTDQRGEIRVRWTDPSGRMVQEADARKARRPHVTSTLALAGGDTRVGIWRVEALLDGDLIDRRTFRVAP